MANDPATGFPEMPDMPANNGEQAAADPAPTDPAQATPAPADAAPATPDPQPASAGTDLWNQDTTNNEALKIAKIMWQQTMMGHADFKTRTYYPERFGCWDTNRDYMIDSKDTPEGVSGKWNVDLKATREPLLQSFMEFIKKYDRNGDGKLRGNEARDFDRDYIEIHGTELGEPLGNGYGRLDELLDRVRSQELNTDKLILIYQHAFGVTGATPGNTPNTKTSDAEQGPFKI